MSTTGDDIGGTMSVEAIQANVLQIRKDLEYHLVESQEFHRELHEHDERIERQLSALADHVLGEREFDFDGLVIRHGGLTGELLELKQDVGELAKAQRNGGFKVHVPWGKIITLTTAIVSTLGAIIIALVEASA